MRVLGVRAILIAVALLPGHGAQAQRPTLPTPATPSQPPATAIVICADNGCTIRAHAPGLIKVCFEDDSLEDPSLAAKRIRRLLLRGNESVALKQEKETGSPGAILWCEIAASDDLEAVVLGDTRRTLNFRRLTEEPHRPHRSLQPEGPTEIDPKGELDAATRASIAEHTVQVSTTSENAQGASPVSPPSPAEEEIQPPEIKSIGGEPIPDLPSSAPPPAAPQPLFKDDKPPDDRGFPDVLLVGGSDAYHCSGVLVAPAAVLTAAHCAPANVVALGNRSSRVILRVKVQDTVLHPSLDAALLLLERPIPVPIRLRRRASAVEPPNGVVRMVGFGVDHPRYPRSFGVKRRVDAMVIGWGCDRRRSHTAGCLSGQELTIASFGGRDTCSGDSGGPVLEFFRGDELRLLAITSRPTRNGGSACGRGGVYVRVDVLDVWMTSILEKKR